MNASAVQDQINDLKDVQLVNYFNVACVMILAYDYLMTLPSEVEHIWKHSFSRITLLFALIRYLPFVDSALLFTHAYLPDLSVHTYSTLFKLQVWFVTIGTAIAAIVLVLRTCALYGNSRRGIAFLFALYTVMVTVCIYFVQSFLSSLQFESNTLPIQGFFVAQSNQGIFVAYISLMIFETLILIMTVLRAERQRHSSPLYQTLYRDSLAFYFYIFVVALCNILTIILAPGEVKLLLTQFHRVVYSIFLGRIILNIRGAMAVQDGSAGGMRTTNDSDRSTLLLGDSLGDIPVMLDIYPMTTDGLSDSNGAVDSSDLEGDQNQIRR